MNAWTPTVIVLVVLLILTSLFFLRRLFSRTLTANTQQPKEQKNAPEEKTEITRRTITMRQWQELTDLSFQRVERYLAELPIPLDRLEQIVLRSVEIADAEIAAETQQRAGENLEILFSKNHPLQDYQTLSDALISWTWMFANWWNTQQNTAKDDFDLCFVEALGVQIKRLGYELAE